MPVSCNIRSLNENDSSDCTSRFARLNQFAAGSAKVSVTRFAEHSENSEGRLTSDIDR